MRITRRALAVVGIVMFWLFVLFGSGLIEERTILLLAVAGFVVPAVLCAWLARMWEPGGSMARPLVSASSAKLGGGLIGREDNERR